MAATLIGFTGSALVAGPLGPSPSLSLWDAMYSWRTGGGFKDNVFLAHGNGQSSAFLSAGADVIVLQIPAVGPQFSFFGGGDWNRFFDLAHNEATAFGQARLEQEFGNEWKGWLAGDYSFQDQVVDLSVTETNRQAVRAFGHTATLRPGGRKDLPHQFWLSLETPATRQWFAAPLDDYVEAGVRLTLSRGYRYDSQFALSYEASWRRYDHDPSRTASGPAITNEVRQRWQHDARLTWRHHWDEAKHWRSTLTLSGRFNEENGKGFYDYVRPHAAAQLRYRAQAWEISAEGRLALYDYSTQTVSATELAQRYRTDWSVAVNLERRLGKYLRWRAGYEREQAQSNDSLETYTVNTVTSTLQWEF